MKRIVKLERPVPTDLGEGGVFVVAQELADWTRAVFLDERSVLVNPDHSHLLAARIGFLWTNIPASRRMMMIAGQAELPLPPSSLGPWGRARFEAQLNQWFPEGVDFLITIYADYAKDADDASFCALIEHELYHCAHKVDEFGSPKFRKDGRPVYGLRGHDVEEFVGIVRRYGAGPAAGKTAALVQAARILPEVKSATIAGACGTCNLKLA